MDFNVKDYGAKGDNSHDDTAAIQAAINAAGAAPGGNFYCGGNVYFPPGNYIVSAKLTNAAVIPSGYSNSAVNLIGAGRDLVRLQGKVTDDYLIECNNWNKSFHHIRGLTIINGYRCLFMNLVINSLIEQCTFYAGNRGLNLGLDVYNTTMRNCILQGNLSPGSIGILSGQCEFYAISVVNFAIGFQGWNVGIVIEGSRFETNYTAILIGRDWEHKTSVLSAFRMSEISFERNDTNIIVEAGASGTLANLTLTGTVAPYYYDPAGNDMVISSITWSNGVATATTQQPHGVAAFLEKVRGGSSTFSAQIHGVDVAPYNRPGVVCTVTGATTFTYPVSVNPGAAATKGSVRLQQLNGIVVKNAQSMTFQSISVGADLSGAGIDLSAHNLNLWTSSFINCHSHVGHGTGRSWKMPTNLSMMPNLVFINSGVTNPILRFSGLPGQAGMPMGAIEGMEYSISDGAVNPLQNFGATQTGGGSFRCKVRYNGSNWTISG